MENKSNMRRITDSIEKIEQILKDIMEEEKREKERVNELNFKADLILEETKVHFKK